MSDELKGRLERLGERAPDGADAFERLREGRERRDRRRRRSALAVGLSVIVVGAVLATTTLRGEGGAPVPRDDDPVVEAWQVPATPYLWPENWARPEDRELLANVQTAADEGTPAVEWRLDPDQVVRRFLLTVLAWEDPEVERLDAPDGTYVLFAATPSCGAAACDWQAPLALTLRQPVKAGDGGIWSVVSASSNAIGPLPDSATDLSSGSTVGFELRDLPEARSAHAGIVMSNGCGETADEYALSLEKDVSELQIPGLRADDPVCGDVAAGYLFVYAMDDTTVPTGDPLLEAAAIEYPWLSIVPVRVSVGDAQPSEPSGPDAVADVAVIECSGQGLEGTQVLTPVVAAQADGVHVEVNNTSGVDLGISFTSRGDNADVGTTELVLDFAPGPQDALCTDTDTDMNIPGVPIEIVDPAGHWISTELEGEACSVGNLDYGGEPEGFADPVEAARDALGSRVEPGDELALTGYPEATVEKVVVLRRDGVPIISVEMFEGVRGWYAHTVTTCG